MSDCERCNGRVRKCLCSVSPVKPQEWSVDTDKYLQIQTEGSTNGRLDYDKESEAK